MDGPKKPEGGGDPNATIQLDAFGEGDVILDDRDALSEPPSNPPGAPPPLPPLPPTAPAAAAAVAPAPARKNALYAVAFLALLGVAITAGVKMGVALRGAPAPSTSSSAARPTVEEASPSPPSTSSGSPRAPSASAAPGVITIPTIDFQDPPSDKK